MEIIMSVLLGQAHRQAIQAAIDMLVYMKHIFEFPEITSHQEKYNKPPVKDRKSEWKYKQMIIKDIKRTGENIEY